MTGNLNYFSKSQSVREGRLDSSGYNSQRISQRSFSFLRTICFKQYYLFQFLILIINFCFLITMISNIKSFLQGFECITTIKDKDKQKQNYNDQLFCLQTKHKHLQLMFKIKPTKNSTTTLTSIITGFSHATQKQRVSLQQNNDFLNVRPSQQLIRREQPDAPIQKMIRDKIKRNGSSIRPESGLNRNLMRASTMNNDSLISDQQLIQQKIKRKTRQRLRPTTSSNNTSENIITLKQKKHRILNKKLALNPTNNNSINIPKPNRLLNNNQCVQSERDMNSQRSDVYVSNEEVLEIMEEILRSEEYVRFKEVDEEGFERIRERLVSNVSIMVLKWSKTIQDRLYNEVRSIASPLTSQPLSLVCTVQQLVDSQIQRQFTKYTQLFRMEQQCQWRQSRLQQLITGRLQKLQGLLQSKCAVSR